MDPTAPPGWEKDSDTRYLHASGVRIERRIYRSREGWVLVPTDLDRAVLEFPPDAAGLERAFAAFLAGRLDPVPPGPPSRIEMAREAARIEAEPPEDGEPEDDDDDQG